MFSIGLPALFTYAQALARVGSTRLCQVNNVLDLQLGEGVGQSCVGGVDNKSDVSVGAYVVCVPNLDLEIQ